MRLFVLVLFMVSFNWSLLGQNTPKLHVKKIDTNDGLPSSTVYYLFEDSKGFIWIATDKGVAKYNGYDFEYFTNKEGLPNNNIFGIKEDPKTGYIWFNAFQGGVCYYDGTKIREHPLNDKIMDILSSSWVFTFAIDSLSNFWFTSTNRNYDEIIDHNFYKIPPSNDTIIAVEPSKTACITVVNQGHIKRISKRNILMTGTVGRGGFDTTMLFEHPPKINEHFVQNGLRKVIELKDGRILAINNRELVILDEQKVHYFDNTYVDENAMHQTYQLDNGEIFICTNKGVSILGEDYQLKQNFLQDFSISHALKDQDGNYWFSSLSNGLFVASSLDLKQYYLDQEITRIEIAADSSVWVSTKNDYIYKFSFNPTINSFNDIIFSKGPNVPQTESFRLSKNSTLKVKRDSMMVFFLGITGRIKALGWTKDEQLMVGYGHGFSIYNDLEGNDIFHSTDVGFEQWVKAIMQDEFGHFWVGTAKGLYLFLTLNSDPIYMGDIEEKLKGAILEIVRLSTGHILIATDGEGMFIIKDQEINCLSKVNGLSSNFINTIFVENDSSIWLGTNRGINHLIGNVKAPTIKYYNTENGFPVNDIRIIKKVKSHLFVGGGRGMTVFKEISLFKKTSHKTYLHHVEVNDKLMPPMDRYEFENEENNLAFHFRTIRFNQLYEYYYRLIGINPTWQKGNSNTIRYNSLPYGNYIFEVKAKNSPALRVPFVIKPRFTQTWYFYSLIVGLILGIIVFVIVLIVRRQNRKTLGERRMSDLENKALRSQMNPHFIFNAMNSIMFLIINNNSKAARRYLSQFSKLMRFVLENSKHNFISLENEIATLRAYLDLEALRYGEQITIHFNVPPTLDQQEYKIPPMLIQPILENALMHGLAPKNEPVNLWLDFLEKKNGLHIIIKDDGIGREASRRITKETNLGKKTSSAILNIEDRIQNINIIYQTTLSFHIEDLYENEQPSGTKVVFYISKINDEEHKSSNN